MKQQREKLLKRGYILGVFINILFFNQLYSQNLEADFQLIGEVNLSELDLKKNDKGKTKKNILKKYNPFSLSLNGMLTLYQKVVSPQLSSGCLYETSCSRFSRKAIRQFGPIKGVFLTADRLSRCNRISATTIHPIRISKEGKVKDEPLFYSNKFYRGHLH